LKIIDELQEKIFGHNSDFLDKLATIWRRISNYFLDGYGQKNPEPAFLSILTEEI